MICLFVYVYYMYDKLLSRLVPPANEELAGAGQICVGV